MQPAFFLSYEYMVVQHEWTAIEYSQRHVLEDDDFISEGAGIAASLQIENLTYSQIFCFHKSNEYGKNSTFSANMLKIFQNCTKSAFRREDGSSIFAADFLKQEL
jgi:hypothetical protein